MSKSTASSTSASQCGHIETLLPWFCNETLDANETSEVKAHLIGCSTCRAELRQTRELLGAVYWSETRDERLQTRHDELRRGRSTAPVSAFHERSAGLVRLAAAAILALGLGYVAGQSQAPTGDIPATESGHAIIASAGVDSDGQTLMADSFESGTVGNWLVQVGDDAPQGADSVRQRQDS